MHACLQVQAAGGLNASPPAADGFQDLTSPLTDLPDSPSPHSVRDTLASIRTIRDTLTTTASLGMPLDPVPHPAV